MSDPDAAVPTFAERERARDSFILRGAGVAALFLVLSCGGCWLLMPDLCGAEDTLRVPAPGGGAEARTFLWNCGATTPYVHMATLTVRGWLWDHERELYRSRYGRMPTLRWTTARQLVVDCDEEREDFLFHGVSVVYRRGSRDLAPIPGTPTQTE